jgi:hypothetical protein
MDMELGLFLLVFITNIPRRMFGYTRQVAEKRKKLTASFVLFLKYYQIYQS